jgi:hypothetical protein
MRDRYRNPWPCIDCGTRWRYKKGDVCVYCKLCSSIQEDVWREAEGRYRPGIHGARALNERVAMVGVWYEDIKDR